MRQRDKFLLILAISIAGLVLLIAISGLFGAEFRGQNWAPGMVQIYNEGVSPKEIAK